MHRSRDDELERGRARVGRPAETVPPVGAQCPQRSERSERSERRQGREGMRVRVGSKSERRRIVPVDDGLDHANGLVNLGRVNQRSPDGARRAEQQRPDPRQTKPAGLRLADDAVSQVHHKRRRLDRIVPRHDGRLGRRRGRRGRRSRRGRRALVVVIIATTATTNTATGRALVPHRHVRAQLVPADETVVVHGTSRMVVILPGSINYNVVDSIAFVVPAVGEARAQHPAGCRSLRRGDVVVHLCAEDGFRERREPGALEARQVAPDTGDGDLEGRDPRRAPRFSKRIHGEQR